MEKRTEFMRIDHILDGLCPTDSSTTSSPREIVVTSDDPGLCTLNKYAVTILSKVTESIRHYNVATSNRVPLLSGNYQTLNGIAQALPFFSKIEMLITLFFFSY